jgi:hypothetical protein
MPTAPVQPSQRALWKALCVQDDHRLSVQRSRCLVTKMLPPYRRNSRIGRLLAALVKSDQNLQTSRICGFPLQIVHRSRTKISEIGFGVLQIGGSI